MTIKKTTGPISSSLGLENIRVVALNNTSINQKVRIMLLNLGSNPKKTVWDRTYTLKPLSSVTVDTPAANIEKWEVQTQSESKNIRFWIGGRAEGNMNLDGNVVLNKQMKRINS